jgi:thiamine-phosphate pyrophosphorylase
VTGADGVHLRSDGPPVARVRAVGPVGWGVGRSFHTVAEVPLHDSADYLLFGTVFESTSKASGAPVQGLAALRDAVRAAGTQTPIWAIGGVTPETAAACLDAGARGLAAIAAFLDGGAAPGGVRARVEAMRASVARYFAKLVQ